MYSKSIIFSFIFLFQAPSHAGLFGPSNFDDCVLDGVKNIKSDQAARAVMFACRNKFPDKNEKVPSATYKPVETPAIMSYSAFGMDRPALNQLISKVELNAIRVVQTGTNNYGYKSYDYGHHLAVEVINRNEFPISSIEIGLPKKHGNCSWNDSNYSEIYTCSGNADVRGSGTFTCQIPRVETKKIFVCLTGFGIFVTESESDAFKKKYGIPSRLK